MSKRNFVVKESNCYSMGLQVNPNKNVTIAQLLHAQTLCFYYDIAIPCSYSCSEMCDILATVNNSAYEGELPARDDSQKGRAYLNEDGVMVFCNGRKKPYPNYLLVNVVVERKFTEENVALVNKVLKKNAIKPLTGAEKTAMELPSVIDVKAIELRMLGIVKDYCCTFDMNQEAIDLYMEQQSILAEINKDRVKMARQERGESFVDKKDNVIKFRPVILNEEPVEPTLNSAQKTSSIEKQESVKKVPLLKEAHKETCLAQLFTSEEDNEDDDEIVEDIISYCCTREELENQFYDATIQNNLTFYKEEDKEEEEENFVEEEIKAEETPLIMRKIYTTSRATEGNKARIVYYGEAGRLQSIEVPFRTTQKDYSVRVAQEVVAFNKGEYFLLKVDKKAQALIDAYTGNLDSFSSDFDVALAKLYQQSPTFDVELCNTKDIEYIAFLKEVENLIV